MRDKDKIEKYLDRYVKKYHGTLCESEKSRYYSFRGRILRVSDHVGINSGNMSILLDSSDQGHYLVHGHTSGNVSVLNYEQTKEFVRTFVRTSFLFVDIGPAKPIKEEEKPKGTYNEKVALFLKTNFTKKQLKQIASYCKFHGKEISKLAE